MFFRRLHPPPRPSSGFWLMLKIGLVLVIVLFLLSMCSNSASHLIDHAPRSFALEQS